MKLNSKLAIGIVALIIGAGGGVAFGVSRNNSEHHDAMMQQAAMQKTEDAKAIKASQDAAMKQEASGDAMTHDDAMMQAGQ